ncbi:ABC transporter ATP-binding protein [Nocardia bovistercoris]|nr:ABC transporter ATP-binding protein [Nocardia bovistercoris]
MAAIAAAVALGACVEIAAPLLTKRAVDAAGVGDTAVIGVVAALLAVVAVGRFVASLGRRVLAGRLSLDVQHTMRVDLLTSLQRLDGAGQDTMRTGQVVSRSITDLQLVQALVSMVPWSALAALQFVLAVGVMVWLSPPLAAIALLVVPAIAVVVYRMRPRLYAATWSAQQRAADLAQHVEETVTGVRVVKGFGQEARMVDILERHSRDLYAERMRAAGVDARFAPVVTAIPQAGMVAVIVVGGLLAVNGTIGLGTFLAFAAYVATMTASARTLSAVIIMSQLTRAAAERVYQVIDAAPGITDPQAPAPLPDGPLGIDIRDLTFGFAPDQPVLRDLDLTVRPGETVAIIGPAGSGKSTLALLLPRFYAPDKGSVHLFAESASGAAPAVSAQVGAFSEGDGAAAHHRSTVAATPLGSGASTIAASTDSVDIAEVASDDLRAAVGVVFDDPFLFSDTIAANIALGRPGATDAEIRAAAELAAADEFIAELPDGYDTVVGERGLTLSGGQRQRVALARTLLARPRILVLDDATSAVDAVTEARIFERLPDRGRRTTLILAHRESTLAQADRVIRLPAPPGPVLRAITTDSVATNTARPGDWTAITGALAETPELRRAIEKLPAATEQPDGDPAEMRRPDPGFRLASLLRPVRLLVLTVVALLAADAVLGIAFPPLVRFAIDSGVGDHDASVLGLAAVIGVVLVLSGLLVGAATIVLTARTGERVLLGLRVRSYAHLQRLGLDYYERELSGKIMTRMTTDVDALSTFLQTGVAATLIGVLTLAGIAVALLVVDLSLAVIVLATLPPLVIATVVFRRYSDIAYTVSRERVSLVNAHFTENVTGLRAVQANRNEPVAARRFAEYSVRYRHSRMRAQWAIALFFAFVISWADLALAVVVFVGAREVAAGATTAGTLIAFVLYLQLLFSPILQLSQVFDGYQQARVGLRRIAELLRTPSSIADDPVDAVTAETAPRGEVKAENVGFRYSGARDPALTDVSFDIPAGSTLALVGPTGAGKSTIVKLLARLYDIPRTEAAGDDRGSAGGDSATDSGSGVGDGETGSSATASATASGGSASGGSASGSAPSGNGTAGGGGAIRLAGVDIRDIPLVEYRSRLGIVPQEAHLFTGDVASNIAFGQPFASPERIAAAAEAVGAASMIASLPMGMGQPVGERGRGLSAGQRQLIALARAELVDPELLLLDEATATLDQETEASVLVASRSLARGRTTVLVAHRLGTAARADRIAVVDHGRIVEFGAHDELLAAGGTYARLWLAAGPAAL